MSGLQSPQLLTDLYRDLRDRRLLALAVVLMVGIAIVPIALSSSSKTPEPKSSGTAGTVARKSPAAALDVVAAHPGLRAYRRRLKGDPATDPFKQRYTTPSGLAAAQLGQTSATTGGDSGAVSPASSSVTTSTSGSIPSGSSTGSQPSTRTSSGGQTKLVFYRLKLRSGQVGGEMKAHDEVPPLSSLPSKAVPALAFLGATMGSDLSPKRAFFIVSNNVSLITSDGACVVGSPCQLLALKPDQHVDLTWTDGLTYRVKLLKFERHVRDKLPAQLGDQSGSSSVQGGSPNEGRSGAN